MSTDLGFSLENFVERIRCSRFMAESRCVLQLIAVLGDVLARVQAIHAKEEYGLSQIVSSIKFVNRTVDAWSAFPWSLVFLSRCDSHAAFRLWGSLASVLNLCETLWLEP